MRGRVRQVRPLDVEINMNWEVTAEENITSSKEPIEEEIREGGERERTDW